VVAFESNILALHFRGRLYNNGRTKGENHNISRVKRAWNIKHDINYRLGGSPMETEILS